MATRWHRHRGVLRRLRRRDAAVDRADPGAGRRVVLALALGALGRVDVVALVALADGGVRALGLARAAVDALLGDLESHFVSFSSELVAGGAAVGSPYAPTGAIKSSAPREKTRCVTDPSNRFFPQRRDGADPRPPRRPFGSAPAGQTTPGRRRRGGSPPKGGPAGPTRARARGLAAPSAPRAAARRGRREGSRRRRA